MIYKYKAVSQTGETIEGFFEGEEESDVLAMIKGNNYIPISIERDIESDAKIDLFSKKVKKKDLAVFCRQFYTMLDAGIGIVKCLEILEKQSQNKALIKALSGVYESVQKGFTLSESMRKHKKVFPGLLINMVQAGEVSGNLDTIMERMAVHFEKENKLENKIKSAMIYPIILSIVSIGVVIFLLIAVMPTFIGMFESSGQALPLPTQILLNISNWLTEFWYLFLGGVILAVAGLILYKETPSGRITLDTIKLKIPVVKDTNVKIITSRFTRTLSTLMSSGIPLLESIEVVGRVVGNKVVENRLEKSMEDIRKGATLSNAVSETRIFPPMVDSMIKVGEESGALDDILYKTADFYDDEVEVALQRLTTLMEPIMLIVMALIIGFIVIAMAIPMFDMVNTI
ncbi:type II secretion system F family protein [Tissierella sp. MB52-C2]|uniref:type II secretion system F family protein n=1 Tax=Tissierella sp. MB52-C2 TaxID=3070999 RepID=UPI00280A83C1|nr:type II secretion system F family protein [Tissierella sp. MB52-C2]WMM26945.1 type II secretion system F family protein [Tissierella sp. MB52-C2]